MADLYDARDSESLTSDNPDDAIEDYLDALDEKDWPAVICAEAYERKEIGEPTKESLVRSILDHAYDWLYEEFSDPDDPEGDPEPDVVEAARVLVEKIVAGYHVWQCERLKRDDEWVATADWVRQNKPDWMEHESVRLRVEALSEDLSWVEWFSA